MTVYTYEVKVQSVGGSNKFYIDGYQQPSLALGHNITYRFDVSDSSNAGHLLQFSTTSDGIHGGGTALGSSDGYTTSGTAGSANAYVELDVTSSTASTLYYFCGSSGHAGMGGTAVTTSAEYVSASNVALRKPILGNSDSWGHYINQNLDTIAGKLPASFVFPTGTGENNQVILSNGSGGTSWGDVALTPEITGVTWYSDSGYSNTLSASEAINIDDATYLKITGQNFGSSAVFGNTAYVQIINTTQSNAVVGNNQNGLTGCVTSASHQSDAEVRFTINPNGLSNISSGDTLKVKFVTGGGESLFATGYVVSADPTSVTTVNSATISNATSVGSFGGTVAGGGQDSNTKLLLNFDRTGGTDIEDSSNVGGDGHKVTASGNAVIKSSPFGDGKSAIYFSGSSDKLVIADHDDFTIGTNDFTFEFWINLSSAQNWKLIAGFGMPESGNTTALTLGTDSGGNIEVEWNDSGTSEHILNGYQAGRWYHIAISRQTSGGTTTSKAFIDGVGKDITIPATLNNPSGGMNFGSGSGDYTGHFVGWLDEIRFVNGTGVYRDNFDVPTSRFSASDEANTKLLIHSNDDFTAIPKTQNSTTSSVGGWSTHGESGGSGNSVAVNGDSLRHTTGSTGVQVWTTRQITGLDQNKKYSASCKIEACSETPAVSLYIGSGDNQTRSSTFSGITGNLGDDTSGNAVGKRLATDAWSPPASGTVYMTVITNQNLNNTCDINEWRIHNWDDASSSDHTITTTGSHHSSAHGGIAPAMTWPASLKQTGSAGVYFDGGSDSCLKIDATTDNGNLSELNLGNNTDFTIDCWVYFNSVSSSQSLFSRRHNKSSGNSSAWWLEIVPGTAPVALRLRTQETATTLTSSTVIYPDRWHHITLNRDVSNSNLITLYVDATSVGTYNSYAIDMEDGTPNANQDFLIGGVYSTGNIVDELNGYIDLFRYVKGSCITPTANPTQIYGAFRSNTIDTVTLTGTAGTGGGYVTFNNATLSTDGNNTETTSALPAGLTLNEAESQDNTATITGDLTADAGSHAINLVARATSDGTDAEIDPNRKQAYSHTITKGSGGAPVLFNARRYIGTSAVRDINGYGFQPDLVWFKTRNQNYHHALFDSVRGGYGFLESDRNVAENSANTNTLNAYNADGFELGTDGTWYLNKTNEKYIAWAWKAGGAPVSITSGTSNVTNVTQSASSVSGFSITKYTGQNGDSYFPHNLGGIPDWILVKNLDDANGWMVWHTNLTSGNNNLRLHDNVAMTSSGSGHIGAPDNTKINLTASGSTYSNVSGNSSYICYAWKAVSGVSAFGSYSGGGAGSTVTVTTGFSPRFIMIKAIDSTSSDGDPDWAISDVFTQETGTSTQGTGNKNFLRPNTSNGTLADSAYGLIEYTSTGFKVHSQNAWDLVSDSGTTYIYISFA